MNEQVGDLDEHPPLPKELDEASNKVIGAAIEGQRLDLLVDPGIIVEVKAVERLMPMHGAQLTSYLKSARYRLGLLINFNHRLLKNGIKRIIN
ncbi:unnamed protein product [marine sediment metagenome]|uniref:GxxExxY protein n=1 Tax=marine sediment metagenome TaxID=412755 RepID=X0TN59_9ZZZZ